MLCLYFRGGGHTNLKLKAAFTLAEVLITLGIIGIVAAMTLPTLIQNHKVKEFEARYKVASNMVYGIVNDFHSQDKTIYGTRYCSANTGNCGADAFKFIEVIAEAFSNTHRLTDKGSGQYAMYKYTNFTNTSQFKPSLLDDGYMEVNNGMSIIVESNNTYNPIIHVDINGLHNKPDRFGYDVFSFVVDVEDRVCPIGSPRCKSLGSYIENTQDFTKSKYCSPSSSDTSNGLSCGYFASVDKDYFKKIFTKY